MIRALTLGFLSLALAAPLAAQTMRVENRINVSAVPGGILVEDGGGFGARGMWCAAAQFALRKLGARDAQRIYVAEGRPPGLGQRAPVLFTLDPTGLDPSSVFIVGSSLRRAGASLTVAHAHGFCADFRLTNRG